MKVKIYFFYLLTIIFACNINAQDELDKRLHIKGKVLHSMGKVKNISVRIVHDDGIVDTVFAKNGKYNLHLELNHKILLEFECVDKITTPSVLLSIQMCPNQLKKFPPLI